MVQQVKALMPQERRSKFRFPATIWRLGMFVHFWNPVPWFSHSLWVNPNFHALTKTHSSAASAYRFLEPPFNLNVQSYLADLNRVIQPDNPFHTPTTALDILLTTKLDQDTFPSYQPISMYLPSAFIPFKPYSVFRLNLPHTFRVRSQSSLLISDRTKQVNMHR